MERHIILSYVNADRKKQMRLKKIVLTLPIEIINVDIQLAREAARLKATKKFSYADCFAAAMARLRKGEVITGDKEFKIFENEVKIAWII